LTRRLAVADIDPRWSGSVTTQAYGGRTSIEGVRIMELRRFVEDGGSFSEVLRMAGGSAGGIPDFDVAQINCSELEPGAIKAWHLHFRQEDLWFVPPSGRLLAGLLDTRRDSPSVGQSQRVILGDGRAQLLLIPRGVAHGVANLTSRTQTMFYFVSAAFSSEDPDERRLDPYVLGREFWQMEAG
jgi:dTDP-4-dehydrorhamnose 3,5-epimerase